jgi:hypothetical protein
VRCWKGAVLCVLLLVVGLPPLNCSRHRGSASLRPAEPGTAQHTQCPRPPHARHCCLRVPPHRGRCPALLGAHPGAAPLRETARQTVTVTTGPPLLPLHCHHWLQQQQQPISRSWTAPSAAHSAASTSPPSCSSA